LLFDVPPPAAWSSLCVVWFYPPAHVEADMATGFLSTDSVTGSPCRYGTIDAGREFTELGPPFPLHSLYFLHLSYQTSFSPLHWIVPHLVLVK